MLEPKRRITLVFSLVMALGGALAAGANRPARASSSFGVSARPVRVLFEPGPAETADRVRIEGMIALGANVMDFAAPTCGYLYFKCTAGDEALCREQWQDIAAAAEASRCVMFGAHRASDGSLLVNGRVRPFSEAPSEPDTFISGQGLGVVTLDCAVDLTGTCTVPPDGAGGAGGGGRNTGGSHAGGMPGHGGAGAIGGAPGSGGAAGASQGGRGGGAPQGAAGQGGGPASGGAAGAAMAAGSGGTIGSGGSAPHLDAGTDGTSPRKGGGGCSLAGGTPGSEAVAVALAWLGVIRARRTRRRKSPR